MFLYYFKKLFPSGTVQRVPMSKSISGKDTTTTMPLVYKMGILFSAMVFLVVILISSNIESPDVNLSLYLGTQEKILVPVLWGGDIECPNDTGPGASLYYTSMGKNQMEETRQQSSLPYRYQYRRSYYSTIPTIINNATDKNRYFIYRCDDNRLSWCGGWADRMKGILAAYIIANLTGRVFKLEILSHNCDLRNSLVPNHVNWSLPTTFHKIVPKSSSVQVLNYIDNMRFRKNLSNTDLRSIVSPTAQHVYYKSNQFYITLMKRTTRHRHELSWMQDLPDDQINSRLFRRLFKPSQRLQKRLNDFFTNALRPSEKLLCAHVRCGKSDTLPHDIPRNVKDEHLVKIWEFFNQHLNQSGPYKIFLMTDSEYAMKKAREQPFKDKLLDSPGQIGHIERTKGMSQKEMCDSQEKLIFDQFVIMHCDVLLLTSSGLGRLMAYYRGTSSQLYCLKFNPEIIPCTLSELKEIYKEGRK